MPVIARVLLWRDGYLYIALNNGEIVYASIKAILELFSNPSDFIDNQYKQCQTVTKRISPHKTDLLEVPGLTLANVYEDFVVEVIHPILYDIMKKEFTVLSKSPINLKNVECQKTFSTNKEWLLKQYLMFSKPEYSDYRIVSSIPIRNEHYETFLNEALNAVIQSAPVVSNNSSVPSPVLYQLDEEEELPIITRVDATVNEYARKLDVTTAVVYGWIANNKLKTAIQDQTGHWTIDINEAAPDTRRRTAIKSSNGRCNIRAEQFPDTYKGCQDYIKARKLVTEEIRVFIRTIDEALYYFERNYHEVIINKKAALIIDIRPNYYCEVLEKTNRDLINEGKSPVVPKEYSKESEIERYHLHHIGQKSDSPFAILPESEHKKYFSLFHQGASGEELHNKEFEVEKRVFWRKYLELYDYCGGYRNIPFKNSKHKKNLRD